MAKQNSVFISYRRTNTWTAQAIYQYLDNQGYDVFFDVDSIRTGDWLETILSQIRARAHFILILTPSAVERFKEPSDVMRLEIETAIDEQRNIIPLMIEGFDFSSVGDSLTGKLAIIPKYNGMEIPPRFFKYAMQDLCERLDVNVNTVIHPTPPQLIEQVDVIQKASYDQPDIDEKQLQAEKLYERGVELSRQNKFQKAVDKFTETIEMLPTYAEAYYKRGGSYFNLGQKDKSLADFQQAVNIDPEHPKIHMMRAYLYNGLEQLDDALVEANQAVEDSPESDEAYFVRALVQGTMQNHKEAIADFTQAIGLNPQYAMTFYNRGSSKAYLQDYKEAIADFTQAIDLNPQHAKTYNNRGVAKFYMQDYEGAIVDYTQAIALNPQYAGAYNNRGNAKSNLSDNEGAIEDFKHALKIDPDYERAKKNLEIIERKLK